MKFFFSILYLFSLTEGFGQSGELSIASIKATLLGQDVVKLYKNSFKAGEILGGDKHFGPAQADMVTTLFSPPICTGGINDLLGKVYTTSDFANTIDFLNIILDESLPILDSINFSFYNSYSFLQVLDKQFAGDKKYRTFKKAFKEAASNLERRRILFDDENAIFRIALEDSRITAFRPKITIDLSTKIKNEFKLGIAAKISEKLKDKVDLSGSLTASIQNAVDKYVEITNGAYDEIRLHPIFVTKAARVIKGFAGNRKLLEPYNDDFTDHLKVFLDDPKASIITGAAVLEASFDFKKLQQLTIALGTIINASLDSTHISKGPEIAASLTAGFNYSKERDLHITTAQSFYYIRYAFSSELEIGAGSPFRKYSEELR